MSNIENSQTSPIQGLSGPLLNIKQFNEIAHRSEAPPKFIVIDGLIGAGKTTLINLLIAKYTKEGKRVHAIYEPVDVWQQVGALAEFYKDIPAKCYEFQTFVYITRIQRVVNEVIAHPEAEVYLLERSIFTDRYIFVELLRELMGPVRMQMYDTWWNMWSSLLDIKMTKWVLLDTSLNESLNRISVRARGEEHGISLEYQTNLLAKHQQFYKQLKESGEPTCVIPSSMMDANFREENSEVLDNIAQMIMADDSDGSHD
jgi:deoxyadenosine/deoxycytidine kinase